MEKEQRKSDKLHKGFSHKVIWDLNLPFALRITKENSLMKCWRQIKSNLHCIHLFLSLYHQINTLLALVPSSYILHIDEGDKLNNVHPYSPGIDVSISPLQ